MGNFWDDFKDGAGKIAKKAIDKTTNAVDITKLNLAKNDTEGKINKLYVNAGKKIYDKYKDGVAVDDDIAEVFVEIDKFKAELSEIYEQLAAIKNVAICSNCGAQNDKKNAFCAKCGSKMGDAEEDATVDIVSE